MATMHESGLESGFEREILHELEGAGEHHELELEGELAHELEGAGEAEWELEGGLEGELGGEQFFGRLRRIARGVGGFVRRHSGVFKRIARIAAPLVATAVGGPLGGLIARGATTLLREGELEDELAHELEGQPEAALHELEGAHEGHPESVLHELEGLHEDETHELHEILHEGHHEGGVHEVLHELEGHHEAHHEGHHEVMAELMAEVAAGAAHEAEAEAMAGAAVVATLSAADQAALRRLVPHLVRGAAILTRVLRLRRTTRPAVRAVPLIVRQTARALRRRATSGLPVTRRTAGAVMAGVTRRVLGNPRVCALAIGRNVRSTLRAQQGARPVRG
jgi:hypothetical protein